VEEVPDENEELKSQKWYDNK
jgi:hypothetical protein